MRTYEFTVIFDANEEQTAKGMEIIRADFAAANIEIVKQDDMGVRNLAYPIKKQEKGHYFYFELKSDPSVINGFNSTFRLLTPVLKFLFVNQEN